MQVLKSEEGFTLVEAVISVAILAIGIMTLYTMQMTSIKGNHKANDITLASTWCAGEIEQMLLQEYSDFVDADGDGTGQDADIDGVDDDGGNFGLNDDTPAAADGSTTSPDGIYTIMWNVAVDQPMPNTKTVHVIVTGGTQAKVEFEYIKDDII